VAKLDSVDPQLIQAYVSGKKAYEQVFPEFYDRVVERVVAVLGAKYPQIEPVVGPRDRAGATARFPELGGAVALDWVAFGFAGMDMYDFHIGTVLQFAEWPVTYRQGLHIADHLYELARGDVSAIDWKQALGLKPTYIHQVPIREHQWLDPVREFDWNDLNGQAEKIAGRVVKYYEAAAAIAAKVQTAFAAGG
jgi:hypothetical protein